MEEIKLQLSSMVLGGKNPDELGGTVCEGSTFVIVC